jgi:FtsH-binding integral membrane protein
VEGFAAISFAILLRNVDMDKLNRAIMIGLCGIVIAWMLAGGIVFALAGDLAVAISNVRLCLLRR